MEKTTKQGCALITGQTFFWLRNARSERDHNACNYCEQLEDFSRCKLFILNISESSSKTKLRLSLRWLCSLLRIWSIVVASYVEVSLCTVVAQTHYVKNYNLVYLYSDTFENEQQYYFGLSNPDVTKVKASVLQNCGTKTYAFLCFQASRFASSVDQPELFKSTSRPSLWQDTRLSQQALQTYWYRWLGFTR